MAATAQRGRRLTQQQQPEGAAQGSECNSSAHSVVGSPAACMVRCNALLTPQQGDTYTGEHGDLANLGWQGSPSCAVLQAVPAEVFAHDACFPRNLGNCMHASQAANASASLRPCRSHWPAVLPLRDSKLPLLPPPAASPTCWRARLRFTGPALPRRCLVPATAGAQRHRTAGRHRDVLFW